MAHREDLALLTDLYELTMAQTYFKEGHNNEATFSLFIRRYPPNRGFFVSCGLEDVLRFLEELRFGPQAIDRLHGTGIFSDDFLEYLKSLRFTGGVRAIPEGRLFFADEPVLEVTAPILEAQLAESFIINQVNLQTLIATKAARCVHAAGGRGVVDFSLRRTHGIDAGMKVARASYIGGFSGTSNVLASLEYGIPPSGTMAHSLVSSYEHEIEAFRAFARNFPERSILLIDTYDTVAGARKAVEVARELAAKGHRLRGVRIDSGDLLTSAREVRRILDEAGLRDVQIVGSGGLDEFDLDALSRENAPYDVYGVGTRMGVSGDAPWTDMAYKLVRYGGRPVLKLSTGKVSLPDEKQVYRASEGNRITGDIITLRDEAIDGAEPLLEQAMRDGRRTQPPEPIQRARERFLQEFSRLGDEYKRIEQPATYPVSLSSGLEALKAAVERQVVESQQTGIGRQQQSD